MKLFLQIGRYCVLTILMLFFLSADAYAYLDPSTGSYLFQIIIAGLLGGLFAIKMFGKNLIAKIKNLFSKEDTSDIDTQE